MKYKKNKKTLKKKLCKKDFTESTNLSIKSFMLGISPTPSFAKVAANNFVVVAKTSFACCFCSGVNWENHSGKSSSFSSLKKIQNIDSTKNVYDSAIFFWSSKILKNIKNLRNCEIESQKTKNPKTRF